MAVRQSSVAVPSETPSVLALEVVRQAACYRDFRQTIEGALKAIEIMKAQTDPSMLEAEAFAEALHSGVNRLKAIVTKHSKKVFQELVPADWLIADSGLSGALGGGQKV